MFEGVNLEMLPRGQRSDEVRERGASPAAAVALGSILSSKGRALTAPVPQMRKLRLRVPKNLHRAELGYSLVSDCSAS